MWCSFIGMFLFNRKRVPEWWTVGGSNPRPPHCERGALPAELTAHDGFDGLELSLIGQALSIDSVMPISGLRAVSESVIRMSRTRKSVQYMGCAIV
jgi:hypothetical protein